MLKKIVILGPESTGKSSLCEQLAGHYQTQWCPEYAREYLLKKGKDYTFNDLLAIAKGQIHLEDFYNSRLTPARQSESGIHAADANGRHPDPGVHRSPRLLFIDTDMYVMKVWCEFVFGKCHKYILDQVVHRKYDLYLLCDIDLPWVKDALREYPDIGPRKQQFKMYIDILANQETPWAVISGNTEERLGKAIEAVEKIIN